MSRGLGENEILLGGVLTDVFSFTYIALFGYLPLACHLTAQYSFSVIDQQIQIRQREIWENLVEMYGGGEGNI